MYTDLSIDSAHQHLGNLIGRYFEGEYPVATFIGDKRYKIWALQVLLPTET